MFVHGTGVRHKRFVQLFSLIAGGIVARFPDAELIPCYWGAQYGAVLAAGGASIPRRGGARGDIANFGDPFDQESAEWQLLLTDPLCELRVLSATFSTSNEELGIPGVRSEGEVVADRLFEVARGISTSDDLSTLLHATGTTDVFLDATQKISESSELLNACQAASHPYAVSELVTATARAVAAQTLRDAGDEALCTGGERDSIVNTINTRLGGSGRAPGGRPAEILGKLALRLTTQPILDHWRTPLTNGGVPAMGDILRYQTRGRPLREHIQNLITASDKPTVAIGHSLGGVALVDCLALSAIEQEPLLNMRLLVTVGSQAPFLHELGALTGLPPTATLPPGFPRWLNIYDRRDLLAYRAEPIFPNQDRVIDYEVNSRQPFPLSHSAYWKLDSVYDRIAEEIEAIE